MVNLVQLLYSHLLLIVFLDKDNDINVCLPPVLQFITEVNGLLKFCEGGVYRTRVGQFF